VGWHYLKTMGIVKGELYRQCRGRLPLRVRGGAAGRRARVSNGAIGASGDACRPRTMRLTPDHSPEQGVQE